MCRIWVKIVYVNPQGIAVDRNPLVTCADFDPRIKRVDLKIPSIGECTYMMVVKMLH